MFFQSAISLPEVGGTTGFGMPFNACGNCPAANAVIGLMYVPCAVAAAMSAACCYNKAKTFIKKNVLVFFNYYFSKQNYSKKR